MKLLTLSILALLLTSCTQYRYDITYEKCNGQTGSVIAYSEPGQGCFEPFLGSEGGVPVLVYCHSVEIRNVCDFSTEITEIK